MEKKLAVIVDNKEEIITEIVTEKMLPNETNVAEKMSSSKSDVTR